MPSATSEEGLYRSVGESGKDWGQRLEDTYVSHPRLQCVRETLIREAAKLAKQEDEEARTGAVTRRPHDPQKEHAAALKETKKAARHCAAT